MQAGAFRRNYFFYISQIAAAFGLLGLAIGLLFVIEPFWLKLLASLLLSIAFIQFAFVIHDAGHRQIFAGQRNNDRAMLVAGFCIGVSRSWWFDTHNRHHAHPNDLDLDPNTALPVLAFSEKQALSKTGLLRFLVRFQAFYFLPLASLEGFGARVAGLAYIRSGMAKYPVAEALAIGVHIAVYLTLILLAMPVAQAALFLLVNQLVSGFYLGTIFAPNHKGMFVPARDDGKTFLEHQVLSSRNIRPNPAVDFLYGGLNYQIEHHLFPTIPRNQLPKARRIVKEFCREHSLVHHETGLVASYIEILGYFHRMSKPLRSRKALEAFIARQEASI